ncbi:MAG TPA: alpha/beta hydrolase [Longimicrobiales bacterium]|nr:alpha/beta hydrolase [Longimicrobiales bacterium]
MIDSRWGLVFLAALALGGCTKPIGAQDNPADALDHRFAEVDGVRIEYFRFGEAGPPIVLIQDHHDYFHEVYGPGEYDELRAWIGFLEDLGQSHRVIAPVRRGWGESDAPGYGYDVATQAEDVLGLMDHLGIRKAVLVGRTLATQELTWIAEHHPDRLMGLAYVGTPLGHLPDADPSLEVTRFGEMYNRVACDIGGGDGEEIDARLDPRRGWRAHFTLDDTQRIAIPTLLLLHPFFDRVSMASRRLDRIEAWAPDDFGDPDRWCDEEARAYFTALSRDPERVASLRQAFQQVDGLSRTQEAMRRAFGPYLSVVWEEEVPDDPGYGQLLIAMEDFVGTLEGGGRHP